MDCNTHVLSNTLAARRIFGLSPFLLRLLFDMCVCVEYMCVYGLNVCVGRVHVCTYVGGVCMCVCVTHMVIFRNLEVWDFTHGH